MTAPYRSLLLDTNIWLDYFLGVRKGSEEAARLIRDAIDKDVFLLYAATTTKDLYYIICNSFKQSMRSDDGTLTEQASTTAREIAWGCLNALTELATAVGCDNSDVQLARMQRCVHQDYEDNLVIAAAVRSSADMLVTNDAALLKHVPVALLTCGSCSDAVAWVAAL